MEFFKGTFVNKKKIKVHFGTETGNMYVLMMERSKSSFVRMNDEKEEFFSLEKSRHAVKQKNIYIY